MMTSKEKCDDCGKQISDKPDRVAVVWYMRGDVLLCQNCFVKRQQKARAESEPSLEGRLR